MKILFLTNNLNRVNGITTFLYNVSKVLVEKYKYEIFIFYSGGKETRKFKELGVRLFDKNFLSFEKRSMLNFLKSLIFCFYFIIKHNIDIINPQIHYSAAYSFYPSIILRRAFIQTVHGITSKFSRLKPFYGKNFFAVSKSSKEYILHLITDAKVTLIRCPFKVNEEKIVKKGKIKIVSAGRLVKEKSFDVFLEAISIISKTIREQADFYILGEGEYSEELLRIKNKLSIDVKFMGNVQQTELFYNMTHVFVMSTGNQAEGLGLGLIEAALSRNLIISPFYPSIRELLNPGSDGFLFKMGNSKELADILENVIMNYSKMEIMVDNFYTKVKKEFSYDKNGKIFNEVYKALV